MGLVLPIFWSSCYATFRADLSWSASCCGVKFPRLVCGLRIERSARAPDAMQRFKAQACLAFPWLCFEDRDFHALLTILRRRWACRRCPAVPVEGDAREAGEPYQSFTGPEPAPMLLPLFMAQGDHQLPAGNQKGQSQG